MNLSVLYSTHFYCIWLQVHFAQLAAPDDVVGPGVVSSDSQGNERITIGTQTTEVLMPADLEPQHVTENVRGCSKAATPQQLADFYHGAWPIVGKYNIFILVVGIMNGWGFNLDVLYGAAWERKMWYNVE